MEANSDSASEAGTDSEHSMEANSDSALEDEDIASDYSPRTRPLKRRKILKEKALDRISILTDSLLLQILSFLPAKDAVSTSILSKRWQFLWTFVPVIDFAEPLWDDDITLASIASSINHTLIQHQSPKLTKFRLQFDYLEKFSSDVDVWLCFVTRKDVEELELDCMKLRFVNSDDDEDEDAETSTYAVPSTVLNNSSLVSLKLVQCELLHRQLINWRSLKVLSLREMSLSNYLMREILCGSPLLEFLELRECWGFDILDIKSERMRKLVVNGYLFCGDASLEISAPHLKSLEISGSLNLTKLSLVDSLSLVDAQLHFRLLIRDGTNDLEFAKVVRDLLEHLRHVRDLTVGDWCLKVLSLLEIKNLKLSIWKCLGVCTHHLKEEQSGIIRLLSSAPELEVMNIRYTGRSQSEVDPNQECNGINIEKYWKSRIKLFGAALVQIKTVKFVDFMAQESAVQLILFLLKRAVGLEKMIIHTYRCPTVNLKRSLDISERILSAPRGSKNSVVLFC